MDLSIVIPSFNTAKETCECIESIYKSLKVTGHEPTLPVGRSRVLNSKHKFECEVIVFDNNSSDDTVKQIEKRFPEVVLIKNKENLGYGKGNNAAVKKAHGETILFLNSDILVLGDAIGKLYSFFTGHENEYQIVGARLRNRDMTLQPSAAPFFSLSVVFAALYLRGDYWGLTRYSPSSVRHVDWVSGACFIMKKKLFEELGGFDENIFMYMEEVDLMYRARQHGVVTGFYPGAEFVHYGAFSTNKGESRIKPVANLFRGFLYFYGKHKSTAALYMLKLLLLVKAYAGMFIGRITGKTHLYTTYEEAYRLVQKS